VTATLPVQVSDPLLPPRQQLVVFGLFTAVTDEDVFHCVETFCDFFDGPFLLGGDVKTGYTLPDGTDEVLRGFRSV
jgi:hypothetical protein